MGIMMHIASATLLIIFFQVPKAESTVQGTQEFVRSTTVGPIEISHGSLQRILRKVHSVIEVTNVASGKGTDSLQLRTGESVYIARKGFGQLDLSHLPTFADGLTYDYMNLDAPLSRVSLNFSDFERRISVEGTSLEAVETLFASLVQDVSQYSIFLGGSSFRLWSGSAIAFLLVFIPAFFVYFQIKEKDNPSPRILWLLSPSILIVPSLFLFPWKEWFPGFGAYSETAGFATKYSAVIGLVGTIASLVGLILSSLAMVMPRKARPEPPSPTTPAANQGAQSNEPAA